MTDQLSLDALEAIDIHVHVMAAGDDASDPSSINKGARAYFGTDEGAPTIDEIAEYYRARNMAAVVFTVDSELHTLRTRISNQHVIEGAQRNADVLIPFASVDPMRGNSALREVEQLLEQGVVKGFKLHPSTQAFFPDDRSIYPYYDLVQAAELPIIFHTGQTGIGAGSPGGSGIKLKYSNPLHIDEVAADFPRLPIVMAHPSVPWLDIGLSIVGHKSNVFMDLSGWAPKYFEPKLLRFANSLLKRKVVFGSDYPLLTPDRWMKEFAELEMKDEVRPLILKENAAALLGLS